MKEACFKDLYGTFLSRFRQVIKELQNIAITSNNIQ